MSSFSLAVVLYAVGVAVAAAAAALRGSERSALLLPAIAMVELLVVMQAALDLARLATGHRLAEPATHIGYLIASLAIVPIAVTSVGLDEGRWGSAGPALGCLVVAVVSIRLHQTLGTTRHA